MNDFLAPAALRTLGPRATLARVAAIDPTILPDGALVFCQENAEYYRLAKTSTLGVDSPYVLSTATGAGRWLLEVTQETFDGDIAVLLNENSYAIYSGASAPVNFTKSAGAHLEQRVKSYLIPAGTATSLSFSSDLNVNEIDAFSAAADYLATFAFFSGVVVGTGRQVNP